MTSVGADKDGGALKSEDFDSLMLSNVCKVCGCVPVNNQRRCGEHAQEGDTLGVQIPVSPATHQKLKEMELI